MVQTVQELEETVKRLNEKLSFAQAQSKIKDDLVKQHARVAEEAVSGWEKAEAESLLLKKQLDDALEQKRIAEGHTCHLDEALQECTRQLNSLREEKDMEGQDSLTEKVREFGTLKTELEGKLEKTNNQLLDALAENTILLKSVEEKTETIVVIEKRLHHSERNGKMLQLKINSLQKENQSLRYEIRVSNKQLKLYSEEREHYKKSADAASKGHFEHVKRISKLETECQRLRGLVRKKVPASFAVGQDNREIEIMKLGTLELKNKRFKDKESAYQNYWETYKAKQAQNPRNHSFQAPLLMLPSANTVSDMKKQSEEHRFRVDMIQTGNEATDIHDAVSADLNISSTTKIVSHTNHEENVDRLSCAESVASSSVSESTNCKKDNEAVINKKVHGLDLSLMDDFIEMERLAALSAQNDDVLTPHGKEVERFESTGKGTISPQSSGDNGYLGDSISMNTITDCSSVFPLQGSKRRSNKPENPNISKPVPQVVTTGMKDKAGSITNTDNSVVPVGTLETFPLNHSSQTGSFEVQVPALGSPHEKEAPYKESRLFILVNKMLNFLEGFNHSHHGNQVHLKNLSGSNAINGPLDVLPNRMAILLWHDLEFYSAIHNLSTACSDQLQKKGNTEDIVEASSSALLWLFDHIFTPTEVSKMNVNLQEEFKWPEAQHVTEESRGPDVEQEKDVHVDRPENEAESKAILCIAGTSANTSLQPVSGQLKDYQDLFTENEIVMCKLNGEISRLHNEVSCLKLEREDLEERLQQASATIESLQFQVQETEERVSKFQFELSQAGERSELVKNQLEAEKSLNEKLNYDTEMLKAQSSMLEDKITSLEALLEEQKKYGTALEEKCLRIQQALERTSRECKGADSADVNHRLNVQKDENRDGLQSTKEREIAEATLKLQECQKTITALGKQLKDLGSPRTPAASLSPSTPVAVDKVPVHLLEDYPLLSDIFALEDASAINQKGDSKDEPENTQRRRSSAYGGQQRLSTSDKGRCSSLTMEDKCLNSVGSLDITSSPCRSPMRFLNIKPKVSRNDKHQTAAAGISRFFSRIKSSN